MFRTKINLRDFFAAAAVLVVALSLLLLPLLWRDAGRTLVISTPQGSQSYSLEQDRTIRVVSGEYTLTVVIRDGKAFVGKSNCPDGVCRESGAIFRVGETVVCAPAGVRISVRGGDSDVDFVAG